MMKEVEFKLKGIEKDNDVFLKALEEFESMNSAVFEDLDSTPDTIMKIRKLKLNMSTCDTKLKDIEDVQNEVVKKLTE